SPPFPYTTLFRSCTRSFSFPPLHFVCMRQLSCTCPFCQDSDIFICFLYKLQNFLWLVHDQICPVLLQLRPWPESPGHPYRKHPGSVPCLHICICVTQI